MERTKLLSMALIFTLIFSITGYFFVYTEAYKKGYTVALTDLETALSTKNVKFNWKDNGDGTFGFTLTTANTLIFQGIAQAHINIKQYLNRECSGSGTHDYNVLVADEYGAGVLTNIGKDWIEQQISGTSTTDQAIYCADSNDATDPALATWTQLPTELTTLGFERQTGTYASTGVGTWTVSKTKTITGAGSSQLWGLHWKAYGTQVDNCLLAADTTPTQKNFDAGGGSLAEVWTLSVTGA